MTFTSSPPRRREVRQQSMAVLPPPSTMTRLPILSMCSNETLESQSMPIWMLAPASFCPGKPRSRPRGAPVPTNTASQPWPALLSVNPRACRNASPARSEDVVRLLRRSRFPANGSAESGCGSCRRPSSPRRRCELRSQAAADRAQPSAKQGRRRCRRCACRSSSSLSAAAAARCRPYCRRRRASGGRSPPACRLQHAAAPARRLAGRSQVRPSTPGNTFDFQLIMYASA
jgi:hypothetical protein